MSSGGSWHAVLGVGKNAGKSEIIKAYRAQALKHHPDKGGDAEQFKKINDAYEVKKRMNFLSGNKYKMWQAKQEKKKDSHDRQAFMEAKAQKAREAGYRPARAKRNTASRRRAETSHEAPTVHKALPEIRDKESDEDAEAFQSEAVPESGDEDTDDFTLPQGDRAKEELQGHSDNAAVAALSTSIMGREAGGAPIGLPEELGVEPRGQLAAREAVPASALPFRDYYVSHCLPSSNDMEALYAKFQVASAPVFNENLWIADGLIGGQFFLWGEQKQKEKEERQREENRKKDELLSAGMPEAEVQQDFWKWLGSVFECCLLRK